MALDITAVREQFPALALTHNGAPRIYLDNPAGTQVPRMVLDRMLQALVEFNANMGGNFHTSRLATEMSAEAHRAMADFFNASSEREVVFGANMTTLTFMMTRVLAGRFEAGDEIILTQMEHDGNASPWRIMAEERGLVVKRLDFDPTTYEIDVARLDEIITPRTKFAAINYSSNILGTINNVKAMCERYRAAGVLTYVDAVQFAPHGAIDVQDLGCDFLVASAYKFYGPHQGILWGREELLSTLPAWKLRVVKDVPPGRYETGTQSLEGQAGTVGAIEYMQWVGRTMGTEFTATKPGLSDRTREVHAGLLAMADYDRGLSRHLIDGLQRIDGLEIRGITNPERFEHRVPTVSVTKADLDPAELAMFLDQHGVYVWNGHSYGIDVIERLGLQDRGGVLRIGPTHYNTTAELDVALNLIEDFVKGRVRPG
jgi:cysteine desulfurase family protein (TIGR01976 family)